MIQTLPEPQPLLHPAYPSPTSPVSHTVHSGGAESETKSQEPYPPSKGMKRPELVRSSDGVLLGGNHEDPMPWEWGPFPMETPALLSGKNSSIYELYPRSPCPGRVFLIRSPLCLHLGGHWAACPLLPSLSTVRALMWFCPYNSQAVQAQVQRSVGMQFPWKT